MRRGRLAFLVACACGLALVATGCGSGRSSAAAFRTQGNRICRDVYRLKRSVDFSTRPGFDRGLAGMRAGVERLAQLRPLSRDEPAYHDLLANLREIDALLRVDEARLLTLQRRLKGSFGRSAARTVERFRALVSPVETDGVRAVADAGALGLGVCATDLSGGAPLAPSRSRHGRPT